MDLDNCAREPIHIPGRIQPHGVLLALSQEDLIVRHVSDNVAPMLGVEVSEILGQRLDRFLSPEVAARLEQQLHRDVLSEINPVQIAVQAHGRETNWDAVAHESQGLVILELERSAHVQDISFSNVYRSINRAIVRISQATDVQSLCDVTAQCTAELTGYERVMVYRFDTRWNGLVVSEAKRPHLDPFLGLQYPASDIPAQARALYEKNWLRIIPDVAYEASDIVPASREDTRNPLDLSFSVLRSVSPIHIQYLKNMGVGASMSVSIIREGKLWGLIAFHHSCARPLPYELRQGLEFVGKFLSAQLAAKEKLGNGVYREKLKKFQPVLHESMRKEAEFLNGLHCSNPTLLDLAQGTTGAAYLYRGSITRVGQTPSETQLVALRQWLSDQIGQQSVFHTHALSEIYPDAREFKDRASGLLCLAIPEPEPSYVLWFKPEVIQTVNWAGNPHKSVESGPQGAFLGPRRSFSLWRETVQFKSLPWAPEEIEAAEDLRRSIIEVDLERQISAALRSNEELDEFGYIVSHDLKEPLRGISRLAEFIGEDKGNQLAEQSENDLHEIRGLADHARKLIGELYEYSKLGRVELSFARVDLNAVLEEVASRLHLFLQENSAELRIPRPLPVIFCDQVRVSEIFSNLITNAVKYNDQPHKWVEISFDETKAVETVFSVRDNGIGISADNQDRIFKMFERLHERGHYGGGNGSGLAIVKRIVQRHRGKIWVESSLQNGSTFHFALSAL